jgi:hypothetical protein
LIPNLIVAALSSNILWGKCVIEIDAESAADGMSKELNIFFRYKRCFILSLKPYTALI